MTDIKHQRAIRLTRVRELGAYSSFLHNKDIVFGPIRSLESQYEINGTF